MTHLRCVVALALLAACPRLPKDYGASDAGPSAAAAKPDAKSLSPDEGGQQTGPDVVVDAAPPKKTVVIPAAPPLPEKPRGLPDMVVPEDNAQTPEKVALGKLLFFDKRLSKDGSASCETCHLHDNGWTDAKKLSTKVGGDVNKRHTPSLYNVGYQKMWYWDGRAPTLEKQVAAAWKGQMGADPAAIATALAAVPEYDARFQQVFGQPASPDNVAQALAAFVRTLQSGDSAWDRFESGDQEAVSPAAFKGYKVFTEKAQCALCHAPPNYTDNGFHNVGIGYASDPENPADKGREDATKDPKDRGKFKTPSLRSITRSGPYFHDGSAETLEAAVRYMAGGGTANPLLDEKIRARNLSDEEVAQLLEFLKALESQEPFEKPKLLE